MKQGQMVASRLPEEMVRDLELIERWEQTDRSTTVRKLLHRARKLFADLLVEEVARSLGTPDAEPLEQELMDLDLLEYCRSALERITASQGAVGGRGTATSGWAIGVAATALGATATLIALVLFLLANFGQPPA